MHAKIFDTLLEPTFIISAEKKVLYCNEPAALLCDISARKLVRQGLEIDAIFSFAEAVAAFRDVKSIHDSSPYQEVAFTTTEGKAGKAQITAQPFDFEGQPSWLVFFRDVTLEETLQKKYRKELEQKEDVIKDLEKAHAELEKYSKNLEGMVAERTAEIQSLNKTMTALLDSLNQGFFIFNKDGDCLDVYSKACETVLENKPSRKKVWDVLRLKQKELPGFQKWMTTVFAEMLPFEDLSPLGPQTYPHTEGKHIQLEYYPLRNNEAIEGVVVVATDITSLVEAKREAETERSLAKMIVSLVNNKRQVKTFIQEAEALLQELDAEFKSKNPDKDVIFRCLHTLKGGAASFSIQAMAESCHLAENLLSEWKAHPENQELFLTLESATKDIHLSFNKFLTENQNVLGSQDRSRERWVEAPVSQFFHFSKYFFTSEQIRHAFIEEFVMEPIGLHFESFQEAANAVAEREFKKLAPIKYSKKEIKIIPEPYSPLFATLIHAFRNAVDHGIEFPQERLEKGKPEEGHINVHFDVVKEDSDPWLFIRISDDGGGISPEKIREKLKAKGLNVDHESDEQVIQHIFDSEFSTKEKITDISGRGVGMDAILTAAKKMGGTAWVESKLNKGTDLMIKVPFITDIDLHKIPKAA